MSTETLNQTLQANVPATFGAGTQFLILASSAPLTINATQIGNSNKSRVFSGVLQGFKFAADSSDDGFSTLTVLSAVAQNLTIVVGDDDVSYPSTVTVAGNVSSVILPAVALTDTAPVACANAAQTAVVPQNVGRRRVTLSVDPAAGAAVYARKTAGTKNLLPMLPGMSYEFDGTYGIDVRNDSGAAVNVYVLEES